MDRSVRELKARLSHYLKLAARDEPVTVTSRGAPIVRLVQAAPQSRGEEPSRAEMHAAVWRLYRGSCLASEAKLKARSIRSESARAKKLWPKSSSKIAVDALPRHFGSSEVVRLRTG